MKQTKAFSCHLVRMIWHSDRTPRFSAGLVISQPGFNLFCRHPTMLPSVM